MARTTSTSRTRDRNNDIAGFRVFYGAPAFVVAQDGVRFPGVRGVIEWHEIESLRLGFFGLAVVLRDERALLARTSLWIRPLAYLYALVGRVRWITTMYAESTPAAFHEVVATIERRAGRRLLVR